MTTYERDIRSRSKWHYLRGLIVRWRQNIPYALARFIARRRGAKVGEGVVMSISLARKVNANVTIGNHVSLHRCEFSSFNRQITIGNNVIIGNDVRIVVGSHNIDSPDWESIYRHPELIIEDYVWLCPHSVVLPSVSRIGRGAVLGSNAVVHKDVDPMSVMSGNPAQVIRKRKCVHTDLVVEGLLGGDYHAYKKARKAKE